MSRGPIPIDERLYSYLLGVGVREHPVLRELREATGRHPRASCQISADEGALLAQLVRMLGAKRTIEVGVFTGYSSIAVALALPADGRIVACDVNEEFTSVAREYWTKAGVAGKIDLRIGPARDTLQALVAAGAAGTFDFAFIDADKASYDAYYEMCLKLVRKGGLVAIDNVLWSGKVVDDAAQDADTLALRALNAKIRDDRRVEICLATVADGLTLALKK